MTLQPRHLLPKSHLEDMYVYPYYARVYSHDQGDFKSVRNSNILIYWPHGFGDFVHLSYLIPLLESSNNYWITRFGDDYISVMEGHDRVSPLYLGTSSTHVHHGALYHNRHFGLDYSEIDGTVKRLNLPFSLYRVCKQHRIDVVLWSGYPETWGRTPFPYHSKIRHLIPYLVREEAQNQIKVGQPLKSSINFEVAPWILRWVEARLASFAGFGVRKLCLISRNGYTSIGKNWGHCWREDLPPTQRREGQECRDFMRLMLRKDRRWMFLVMEDRLFSGDDTVRSPKFNSYSYAELFGISGASSVPYGIVMKALVNLATLSIGVPTGTYHLSMAKADLPTIGIWTEHLPSWFDEPKTSSIHLISRNVCEQQLDLRPGSFCQKGELEFRMLWVASRVITGAQVLSAVEQLFS